MASDSTFTIVVDKSLVSTLGSAVIFVASAWLTTTLQRRSETFGSVTSSVSLPDDNVDDNDMDDENDAGDEDELFLRRRLEHRLSFQNLAGGSTAKASHLDSKVDFNPKNSNWHHFECTNTSESNLSGEDDVAIRRVRPSLTIRESLYGETVASSQSSVSKEEKSNEDEFSVTSADHFVWTEAHYSPKHSKTVPNDMLQSGVAGTLTTPSEEAFPTPLPPSTRRSVSVPMSRCTDTKSARVRANYNARIMPDKVILVRHGQSAGNIDERLYSTMPDNAIPLTQLGWDQARAAGQRLKYDVLPQNCNIHFIVSPYVRTVETFHGMLSAWCDPKTFDYIPDRQERIRAWYSQLLNLGITWAEDPRIREQVSTFQRDSNRRRRNLCEFFQLTTNTTSSRPCRTLVTCKTLNIFCNQNVTDTILGPFTIVLQTERARRMCTIEYLPFSILYGDLLI